MATSRVAAGVIIHDAHGRVLLVKPTYKAGWEVPGSYVKPDESPRTAAAREVHEELGASIEPGRLLAVDWAPTPRKATSCSSCSKAVTSRPSVQSYKQARSSGPSTTSASSSTSSCLSALARRVAYALGMLEHAGDPYLEHGRTVLPEPVSARSTDE
ncbi:MAG: NUDIX domain-containing protein [Nocardioidaceae bacterium]